MRYIAIVHTWNDGRIDYVSVLNVWHGTEDAKNPQHIDGKLSPLWLQERAAMLRLCDISAGGTIGKKFSDNIIYVNLDKQEYEQLINLTNTGAEDETLAKTTDS